MLTAEDLGVKAIDDWTLEVTMQGPRSYFPQVVAYQAAVPAPRWKVEELGDDWALGEDGEPDRLQWSVQSRRMEQGSVDRDVQARRLLGRREHRPDTVIDPISPAANEVLLFEQGSGDQQLDWAVLPAGDYERYMADPELVGAGSPYVYYGIWMLNPQVDRGRRSTISRSARRSATRSTASGSRL